MRRSAIGNILVFFLITFCYSYTANSEEIRDYHSEPGINPFNETENQSFNEQIDPFSGAIQLSYTDIFIPGNGGMDIRINRFYNSIQTNKYPILNINGFGWTMHFGRLLTRGGKESQIYNQSARVNTLNSPSIEFPDGGRELLVVNHIDGNNDGTLITKSNWRAECIPGEQGMRVTSPDGTRYIMDKFDTFQGEPSWFTSRIEDRNGNWIRIDYDTNETGVQYITQIYLSDSGETTPLVTYEYEDKETAGIAVSAINAMGKTWRYTYEKLENFTHPFYKKLVTVNRPDGKKWKYAYNGRVKDPDPDDKKLEDGLASYSLNTVAYPYGGKIEYIYQWINFTKFDPERTTSIKTKKTFHAAGQLDGEWTYEFAPYSDLDPEFQTGSREDVPLDVTTVTGPDTVVKYRHYGKGFVIKLDGGLFRYHFWHARTIGLQADRRTYDLHNKLLEQRIPRWFAKRLVSNQHYIRGDGPQFITGPGFKWSDDKTYRVEPAGELIRRDGKVFSTIFRGHDAYGLPKIIIEESNLKDGSSRVTKIDYTHDTDSWVLGRKDKVQIFNRSKSDTDDLKGEMIYTYDDKNNLISEKQFGTETVYGYTHEGDLSSTKDANGHVTTYSDYRGGIAQQVEYPDSSRITRVINGTSYTLDSVTDANDNTMSFTYNGINQLKSIDYPINEDVTIVYGAKERTLTRGNLKNVVYMDGFGRRTKIENIDTDTNETITTTQRYDALGRTVFTSYLNSQDGASMEYDGIGRILKETHADSSFKQYSYKNYATTVIGERGNKTVSTKRYYGAGDSGLVVAINTPVNATHVNYDIFGKVIQIAQGELDGTDGTLAGSIRRFFYDKNEFLIKEEHPDSRPIHYGRDGVGNMAWRRVGELDTTKNTTTRYRYDPLSHIKAINFPLGTDDIAYTYKKNGQLDTIKNANAFLRYHYDKKTT